MAAPRYEEVNFWTDYDREADVLYVALGKPRAAYSEEQATGLLFRWGYDDLRPAGVTVLDFHAQWGGRLAELAREVAAFLDSDPAVLLDVIRRSR